MLLQNSVEMFARSSPLMNHAISLPKAVRHAWFAAATGGSRLLRALEVAVTDNFFAGNGKFFFDRVVSLD